MSIHIINGDCRDVLPTLGAGSVQCCVTSPPYFGLRDYGVDGQIGLEATPDAYVAEMVAVFREVRRALADDGVLWLNLGDSYASSPPGNKTVGVSAKSGLNGVNGSSGKYRETLAAGTATKRDTSKLDGIKPKDLLGIPWLVAFALRADGWYLRSDVIWHKPNPMPESVTDRPTSAHEHVFLLTKSARYFYDADAIREENTSDRAPSRKAKKTGAGHAELRTGSAYDGEGEDRNARNVWSISTQPYAGSHFATMPAALADRCIRAGSRVGDVILDPFGGAGTTGLVADRLNRNALLIELNPAYRTLAAERLTGDCPMFAEVA